MVELRGRKKDSSKDAWMVDARLVLNVTDITRSKCFMDDETKININFVALVQFRV